MNWEDRRPLIGSGTSLPGWAILSSYQSLHLFRKYQIAVNKEKEKREINNQQGDNEAERLQRTKFKLAMGTRLHMEGIVVPRSLIT